MDSMEVVNMGYIAHILQAIYKCLSITETLVIGRKIVGHFNHSLQAVSSKTLIFSNKKLFI